MDTKLCVLNTLAASPSSTYPYILGSDSMLGLYS